MPDSGIILALVSPKIPLVVNVRDCNPSQNSRLIRHCSAREHVWNGLEFKFSTPGKTLFYFGSGTFLGINEPLAWVQQKYSQTIV